MQILLIRIPTAEVVVSLYGSHLSRLVQKLSQVAWQSFGLYPTSDSLSQYGDIQH